MKVLIYTDPHFCEKYSIVTKMGDKYSVRLENLIKSINWAEDLAWHKGCQYVICAGDFFDKPNLTQQEITAINEIKFAPMCAHYFLVGNHESEENDLHYNSTEILQQDRRSNFIIAEPRLLEEPGFELAFLPYITEARRQEAKDYFPEPKAKRLLISHNDLFGIQMGPAVSTVGFKPEDLASICDLCVNGHLHNGTKINEKVINLGNLTGKDFGEDAFRYKHNVMLVDTDTMTYELIENPYALNFYKIEINTRADLAVLNRLSNNAVVSVKCRDTLVAEAKELIASLHNIIESRVVITREVVNGETAEDITDLTVDQYVKFAECCREKLENNAILEEELSEILK
jgi:DNA repair exonuclease SbcCD nuclease subunit